MEIQVKNTPNIQKSILSYKLEQEIATITLTNPEKRNPISLLLIRKLQTILDKISSDKKVKVVIIESQGPVFSAGHDLNEVKSLRKDLDKLNDLFKACSKMMTSIVRLPKPVIAKVDGLAAAAGCQLVASCDLVYASNTSSFCTPGVNIGLFCSTPMVALSRSVNKKQSMEMLLTGEVIDANTAHRFGLVNKIFDVPKLDSKVKEIALNIAQKSPLILAIGKEAFYEQIEMTLDDAYTYTSQIMVKNMQTLDATEGIKAFVEKRKPKWQGK
tara:strand:+ start:144 stop:956 length:813 start_codon:yes stop_codon:yes gene_type:complete